MRSIVGKPVEGGSTWPLSSISSPAASSVGLSATGCTATWRLLRYARPLVMRRPPKGLIHHSDRGSQYCSVDYQAELRRHGIRISMSGKGNCYDNAMVETVFKTIKSELVWRTVCYTRAQAEHAIARYIDRFYNPVSCPLLSGPLAMTVWTKEGTTNAFEEAQARGDHRQAA